MVRVHQSDQPVGNKIPYLASLALNLSQGLYSKPFSPARTCQSMATTFKNLPILPHHNKNSISVEDFEHKNIINNDFCPPSHIPRSQVSCIL